MMGSHKAAKVSRRKSFALLGTGGALLASTTRGLAQEGAKKSANRVHHFPTLVEAQKAEKFAAGDVIETSGYHRVGDGGSATYGVEPITEDRKPNGGELIALQDGLMCRLRESKAVNYYMFGALGDGKTDDGDRIKAAHNYAAKYGLPIVQMSGDFVIRKTNNIPIQSNVHWGKTSFHIDESLNDKSAPRFTIRNDKESQKIKLDEKQKQSFLSKLKPGVQIISELAAYAGCLVYVEDKNDPIGVRAGYNRPGRPRQELFYVEEEGRIIGDIAWGFKNYTTLTAKPCNDNYLIIDGGTFYMSGSNSGTYNKNGIQINRSRVVIRNQWVGLEPGKQDTSPYARSGFYLFSRVYDVTLENIRAMPWEKNRVDKSKTVAHGTYGISGNGMLNCTFRNLTAEAGYVAWGVFGTNMNKNFRLENCRLNRIDIHFHCWNLYIRDCVIGVKGITVTGGGDLFIENTRRHGSASYLGFLHLRPDFGAKWDGDIRLVNCRLQVDDAREASIISQRARAFDYKYPIGLARSVVIDDFVVDYSMVPNSTAACWVFTGSKFSKSKESGRLFFPRQIRCRNIEVVGRKQGIRLFHLPKPEGFLLEQSGGYDGTQLHSNSRWIFESIDFEDIKATTSAGLNAAHLLLGGVGEVAYEDEHSLFPEIYFHNCKNLSIYLGQCAAAVNFSHCTLNVIYTPKLRGRLNFTACHIQPNLEVSMTPLWTIDAQLGVSFTNCTIFSPKINGKLEPTEVDKFGFIELNKGLKYNHLNTSLGRDVLNYLREQKTTLQPEFIAKLKAHHELEGQGG